MNYNDLFDSCVTLLDSAAAFFGITYKEINIWVFVIIEPIVFFLMLFYILHLNNKLYRKAR